MERQTEALGQEGTFPLLIHPEVDESLFGFALRFCDRNALDRGSQLLSFLGARTMRPPFSPMAIERLSGLSGRRVEELQRMQPKPLDDGNFLFLGHQVARTSIIWDRLRFCPNCLEQRQIYRQVWDYAPMTSCAAHHVRLVHRCLICGADLPKGRGIQRWMKCPLCHDLAHATTVHPPPSLCSAYVEWRFASGAPLPPILQRMPSVLREARPDAVISLARFLGRIAQAARGALKEGEAAWPDDVILEEGFAVVAAWPDRLEHHLEILHRISPSHLFPAQFRNWLRRSWRQMAGIDGSDLIRLELDRFCAGKGFLFDPAKFRSWDASDGDRIPAHLACRATGLGTARFNEMIREHGWIGWQGACSGQPFCLLRHDLDAWSTHSWQRLGISEVGQDLGCRAGDVFVMMARGCFGRAAADRVKGPAAEAFLLPIEVAGLKDCLRRIIRSRKSQARNGDPISLSKASFHGHLSISDLLGAILDGRVTALDWREPLLGGLLLAASDVAILHSRLNCSSPG